MSRETKRILRHPGSTIHETSDDLCPRVGAGTDQSIALAKAISKPRPDIYYMPNQYENDANFSHIMKAPALKSGNRPRQHNSLSYRLRDGRNDHRHGSFLKEKRMDIKAVAIQAQKNHLLQGLRNFEESSMPDLFKRRESVVDEWMTATNADSFNMVKQLATKEGLLVGPSSGSVMASMLKTAEKLDNGVLVGIFADDGRKFKSLYSQQNVFSEVTNTTER